MESEIRDLYTFNASEWKEPYAGDSARDSYKKYTGFLEKYLRKTVKDIGRYIKDKWNEIPLFEGVEISIEELPTYCIKIIKKGEEYLIPVAKIFGFYDPETRRMKFDPVIFRELKSWKGYSLEKTRGFFEKYGINIPKPERVIGEEHLHLHQDNSGIIDRLIRKYGKKSVDLIEGAASYISDKLFGETDAYRNEKQEFERLVNRFGEKRAFYGEF